MRRLVYDHVARTAALQRTSLSSPPTVDSLADEFKKLMDELTPQNPRSLRDKRSVPLLRDRTPHCPEKLLHPSDQLDALDRYYSEEILEKLDGIVSRASVLDRMGLEIVPNRRVQFLFEEAHRCYLYGFHLACAVFCRAILEGALKEVADPHSETNQSIHEMIAMAVEKGILTDDRPRCAREVAKAGNRAIHDPEMFDRDYSAEKVRGSSDQHAESAGRTVPAFVCMSVLGKHAVVPHERGRSRATLKTLGRIEQNCYWTFIY